MLTSFDNHLYHRLHRLDLLPPNFVKADSSFRLLIDGEENGKETKKRQRPISSELTETHYFRKQLPSSVSVSNTKNDVSRPVSWALPKLNFSRMLNGAEVMAVEEQNHHQALTTTCSRVTTDL